MNENYIETRPRAYICEYCWFRRNSIVGHHSDIKKPIDTYSPMACPGICASVNSIGNMRIVDFGEMKW